MTRTAAPSYSSLTAGNRSFDRSAAQSECTVAQAAEFLDVSEGYVKELLGDGLLLFRQENGQSMIEWNNLQAYGERRKRLNAALDEMVRWDQEMGLYDD